MLNGSGLPINSILNAVDLQNLRSKIFNSLGVDILSDQDLIKEAVIQEIRNDAFKKRKEISSNDKVEKKIRNLADQSQTCICIMENQTYFRVLVNGNSVNLRLFDGTVLEWEVYKVMNVGNWYRFKIRAGSCETWTEYISEEKMKNAETFIDFLDRYMVFSRQYPKTKEWILYFKDFLRFTPHRAIMTNAYSGWRCILNDDQNARKYIYVYHGFFGKDGFETESIQKRMLQQGKKEFLAYIVDYWLPKDCTEDAGFLLLYHFTAMIRYFMDYPMPEKNLLLIGSKNERGYAMSVLPVLCAPDRSDDMLYVADKNLSKLKPSFTQYQDDVILIAMDGASKHIKTEVITKFQNASYKDDTGKSIQGTLPVFFDGDLTRAYSLEDFIIMDLSVFPLRQDYNLLGDAVGSFSKWIFDTIQNSGDHWPKQICRLYKKKLQEEQVSHNCCHMKALFRTTLGSVQSMLLETEVDETYTRRFMKILHRGYLKYGRAMAEEMNVKEYFKQLVIDMAEKGGFRFLLKEDSGEFAKEAVCYDESYYYFPQDVMEKEILCHMDNGMHLFLLKNLREDGILRCYDPKNKGYRYPYRVKDQTGNKINLCGYVIKKSFFEDAYGVRLYERGNSQ